MNKDGREQVKISCESSFCHLLPPLAVRKDIVAEAFENEVFFG